MQNTDPEITRPFRELVPHWPLGNWFISLLCGTGSNRSLQGTRSMMRNPGGQEQVGKARSWDGHRNTPWVPGWGAVFLTSSLHEDTMDRIK